MDHLIDALLRQMTLEEKFGQLTQYSADGAATGPVTFRGSHEDDIRAGRVGSMLNVLGSERTRAYQDVALQSRLKIPLLFGQDVVHGYKTTFPIPLAEAASFDLPAIQRAARVAATEAAASGIHWTFAPMVDVSRDPRWGRVLEGAGEDTFWACQVATARVKGFQGQRLGDTDAVMACAKHFAGYGAASGGRDYNSVDMSERMLWEVYLPPFKAALDAGAATFMNAFNDLNGVPANASAYLQRTVLKGAWGFTGFVVSDWGSIGEMVAHGFSASKKDAALAALTAGSDMDMESSAYRDHGAALVAQGLLPLALVDDAVRRVLRKKFELGLFGDPYRFNNPAREKTALNNPAHRAAARDMAAKSIVLLKNEQQVLPLRTNTPTLAFIGPLVKADQDNEGAWSVTLPDVDYSQHVVTQWQGVKSRLAPASRLLYAQGCDVEGTRTDGFAEAVAVAQAADVVVVSVGEHRGLSGEARSRAYLGLPGVQLALLQALHAALLGSGKPLVVLLNTGRPLVINWLAEHASALLCTWWLGSEAGNAIADVLFGAHNPSARLPMSFPRSEGQIPIYYNHFNTGRPAAGAAAGAYTSHYIDEALSPCYAFGHGLSYSRFAYSQLRLSPARISLQALAAPGALTLSLQLTNTSAVAGDEVVQLYLRDCSASVIRPVKELKGVQKIHLLPGQTATVRFDITPDTLSFFNAQLQWTAEPGQFELMVGAASDDIRLRETFELLA